MGIDDRKISSLIGEMKIRNRYYPTQCFCRSLRLFLRCHGKSCVNTYCSRAISLVFKKLDQKQVAVRQFPRTQIPETNKQINIGIPFSNNMSKLF